jgi:hypothetical protein
LPSKKQTQDLRVTIRLLPDKADVYEDYKKVITERLHSDICYVTTMLMESFTNAVNESPNADSLLMMNFVKQNVQINMGCNFNYFTKKARRNAHDPAEDVITDTHHLMPEVVSQYPDLSEKARQFWFKEFQDQGLIPKDKDPSVSTGKRKGITNFFKVFLHNIVRHLSRHGKSKNR